MGTILVVDDSETLRGQIRNILEAGGFNALEAGNGLEGIAKLKANKEILLILCDVNMPQMDGITMCQTVHKDEAINRIPIIMLTTEASADLKKSGKEAGVVAWMTKPVNGEKLIATVTKVLGRVAA